MIRRDEVYKIGKLGKPHGVKGEITFAITDDVFDRVDAEYLVLDGNNSANIESHGYKYTQTLYRGRERSLSCRPLD